MTVDIMDYAGRGLRIVTIGAEIRVHMHQPDQGAGKMILVTQEQARVMAAALNAAADEAGRVK